LRTTCSGVCRFLVAMILSSLPAHNVGHKTLTHPGLTDWGQANGTEAMVTGRGRSDWDGDNGERRAKVSRRSCLHAIAAPR
jgi:hypothetical protein